MIRFSCNCGRSYEVEDRYAGKSVRCKQCQTKLIIPALPETVNEQTKGYEVVEDQVSNAKSDSQYGIREDMVQCPHCGEDNHEGSSECFSCKKNLYELPKSLTDKTESKKPKADKTSKKLNKVKIIIGLIVVIGIVGIAVTTIVPPIRNSINNMVAEAKQRKEEQVQKEADLRDDALFVERYAGVAQCLKDIDTAFELGINYMEYKPLVFALKSEWNEVANMFEIEKHKYHIKYAETAVEEYVAALEDWSNSISDDTFTYRYQRARDEHRKTATEKADSFLFNYKQAQYNLKISQER